VIPLEWQQIAAGIHGSGRQLVVAATGGGSGAIAALLQTPGASRSILEAVVPYSLAALVDWIGGKPDQACSETTARAMAMAAFIRARELAPRADPSTLVGVACTASLATDRPKRGERRVHVAVQTVDRTEADFLPLTKLEVSRAHDEQLASEFLLSILARACGVDIAKLDDALPEGGVSRSELGAAEVGELMIGRRHIAMFRPGSTAEFFAAGSQPNVDVLFPGAFNPPHVGHLRMADLAEQRLGKAVTWELSIANVDKPPLDFIAIDERVAALRGEDAGRLIALTAAPTFVEKAKLFPGVTFVVGADTMSRIAEPRYYEGDLAKRDRAIAEIEKQRSRFLVFGRATEDRFLTLGDLDLPAVLRQLCDEVPVAEFREDVSSTALRQIGSQSEAGN
jgi:nicotinamide mononucleotide (NMN) deamidase PncC